MRPAGVAFCLALAAPALAEEAAADEGDKPAELDSVRSALGVARSFDKLGSILPPAAGVGLRLKASKAHRVDASIDFVFGEDSQAFYFYIGEAF